MSTRLIVLRGGNPEPLILTGSGGEQPLWLTPRGAGSLLLADLDLRAAPLTDPDVRWRYAWDHDRRLQPGPGQRWMACWALPFLGADEDLLIAVHHALG